VRFLPSKAVRRGANGHSVQCQWSNKTEDAWSFNLAAVFGAFITEHWQGNRQGSAFSATFTRKGRREP
jgi:hypothetical protein